MNALTKHSETFNPWAEAANKGGGVEGMHLKCSKGIWTVDGMPLETGPDGAKIVMIMPSVRIGIIQWVDGRPGEMKVGFIQDGFVAPEPPDDTWNVYTECLGVFVDDEYKGAPTTFTSSSWGGRFSFWKLVKPFARMGGNFPVCTLANKPRGDKNGNVDPVFVITGWASPADFPGYAAPPAAAQIAHQPDGKPGSVADIIDDDLPF